MMECKLILERSGFPEKFSKIQVEPFKNVDKVKYVEEKVLRAINDYNPKLNLTKIEYEDIKNQFPKVHVGKFVGLLVQDREISQKEQLRYREEQSFVWEENEKFYARSIISYVFFSAEKEEGRNVLFTQSIFPEIIEYMNDFISSPSYTIANKPIYFINIINKKITAPTLLKRLGGLVAIKFEYIEVFASSIISSDVPSDLEEFIKFYEPLYREQEKMFFNDFYQINFNKKNIKLCTNKLVLGDYLIKNPKTGKLAFKGSSEKFYWSEILPIIILGFDNEYTIDFSELETFYLENKNNFKDTDEKFDRFRMFINYIKKLSIR